MIISKHLLLSPSYHGDPNEEETYPQYNPYMLDSLNKLVRYAGDVRQPASKKTF